MDTKNYISIAAALASTVSLILSIRNADRYGLKKIVMEKKLKTVIDLYDLVQSFNFNYTAVYDATKSMDAGNFKLTSNMKPIIISYEEIMLHPVWFDLDLFENFSKSINDLRNSRLIDESIYKEFAFLDDLKIFKKNVDVTDDFCKLFNNWEDLCTTSNLVRPKSLETLHDFIIVMENALKAIEKWLDGKSGLNNVLRS